MAASFAIPTVPRDVRCGGLSPIADYLRTSLTNMRSARFPSEDRPSTLMYDLIA